MAAVNVVAYVEELDPQKRDKLWDSPWTCQAVLRSLPELSKHYVMRMLFIGNVAVPSDVVAQWVSDKAQHGAQHRQAIESLVSLGLLFEAATLDRRPGVMLHPRFSEHIQWALSGRGHAMHALSPEVLEATPSAPDLDEFAHSQWEALQLYILTTETDAPALPRGVPADPLDVHRLLEAACLVSGPGPRSRRITEHGFRFLLHDSYRQLWQFLTHYIHDAELRSGAELSTVMSFLMQLGFMRVGQPYPFAALAGGMERAIAAHMMQLGLLMPFQPRGAPPGPGGLYYCPTRLAASLCSGFDASGAGTNADIAGGLIIVESNYRVYCYTSSPVTIAILEVFTRTECVLPNVYCGALTRESVLRAVQSGISSQDIIDFLVNHAHPITSTRADPVPEVVTDQIRLWEAETLRVQSEAVVLYEQFETDELYARAREFTANLGMLVWACEETKKFAAKDVGHEQIKEYIKAEKARLGA